MAPTAVLVEVVEPQLDLLLNILEHHCVCLGQI